MPFDKLHISHIFDTTQILCPTVDMIAIAPRRSAGSARGMWMQSLPFLGARKPGHQPGSNLHAARAACSNPTLSGRNDRFYDRVNSAERRSARRRGDRALGGGAENDARDALRVSLWFRHHVRDLGMISLAGVAFLTTPSENRRPPICYSDDALDESESVAVADNYRIRLGEILQFLRSD